jgi:hypothetical protein
MDQLRQVGLWKEAEAYREEVRHRLRGEGVERAEAVSRAWAEVQERFGEQLELLLQQEPEPFAIRFPEGAEGIADILDPDYEEAEPAAQLRDAYAWVMAEFYRIVIDSPATTTVDYSRAHSKPPIGSACSIVEAWAAKPRDKRDGLFREIRACLGPVSTPKATQEPQTTEAEAEAYLDELKGTQSISDSTHGPFPQAQRR